MNPEERKVLTDEDEMAAAPESGQIPDGRENPWDDESPDLAHPWPPEHHASSKDEL